MNVSKVIRQLKTKHPKKAIIQNNPTNPTEIVCETISSAENPKESVAIAVIDQSIPHFHKKTTEVYEVIKGTLKVKVDEKESLLKEGQKCAIKPNQVHSASGNETWVKCIARPGWKAEDHILIE